MVIIEQEQFFCFMCGEQHEGDDDYQISRCSSCGGRGVMAVTTAFDKLNDLYREGAWSPHADESVELDFNIEE